MIEDFTDYEEVNPDEPIILESEESEFDPEDVFIYRIIE